MEIRRGNILEKKQALKGFVKDILVAVTIALAITVFFKPVVVKGSSMKPTLTDSNYLILSKASYWNESPERGDIIVFKAKTRDDRSGKKRFIKRVIGVCGDKILIKNGKLYVNDRLQKEEYIGGQKTCGYVNLVVPEKKIFCLGDNRGNSTDSRDIGCVSVKAIEGKALIRLYPFNKVGGLGK